MGSRSIRQPGTDCQAMMARPRWQLGRRLAGFVLAGLVLAVGIKSACGQAAPAPGRNPGRELFLRKGCVACHTLDGDPAAVGTLGPDLSGLAGQLSAARIRAIIADPLSLSASTSMPQLDLSAREVQELTTFVLTPPATPTPPPTPRPRPTPTSGF